MCENLAHYRINSNILGFRGRMLSELREPRLKAILRRDKLSQSDRENIELYLNTAAARTPEQNRARLRAI
jgi:hypothetical protein